MANRLVIGICGGTGSGKTTITERIISALSPESVLILQQDHYYKDFPHLPLETPRPAKLRSSRIPSTWPLLIEHVRQLKAKGSAVDRPVYDFTKHARAATTVRLNPSPAIILEGILIFENKALRDLMDVKIFRRHGRGPSLHSPLETRHSRKRQNRGIRRRAISLHGAAHAHGVHRTFQKVRRRHHPRGRPQ